MEIWPNFFIIGAIRAGTTSLYEYLKEVPSIYMSPIKEPSYFAISIDEKQLLTKPIRDKKKYLKLFKNVKDEKAIGESSPTYLWDPKTPKLIHETIPKTRIIIILRDPVERAYSHYLMMLNRGSLKSSFEKAIAESSKLPHDDFSGRVINAGFYSKQVKRYLDIFPRQQIKIFIFEEFVKDTKKSVKQVLDFLGVNEEAPDSVNVIHNEFMMPRGRFSSSILQSKTVKEIGKRIIPTSLGELAFKKVLAKKVTKPKLSEENRELLEEIYRKDVAELKRILKISIPWLIAS